LAEKARLLQVPDLLVQLTELGVQLELLMSELTFLNLQILKLLLCNQYGMIKGGHSDLTRMIEKRVIHQLRPDISFNKQLPTDCQDMVPESVLTRNGLGYVIYGIHDLDI